MLISNVNQMPEAYSVGEINWTQQHRMPCRHLLVENTQEGADAHAWDASHFIKCFLQKEVCHIP